MSRDEERFVSGWWCHEVLGMLPDYLEGQLDGERRATLEAHVGGCSWCERFGGSYAATVQRLKASWNERSAPDEVSRRLAERLVRELGSE